MVALMTERVAARLGLDESECAAIVAAAVDETLSELSL